MKRILVILFLLFLLPNIALASSKTIDDLGEIKFEGTFIKQKLEENNNKGTIEGELVGKTVETPDPQLKPNTNLNNNPFSSTQTNDDPNNAEYIVFDNTYGNYLTEQVPTRWYVFQAVDPGKITVFMQTVPSPNVDYDLYLFKLNENTMTLEDPIYSTYGPGMNEQLSTITSGGIYFIAIHSYYGYDNNNPYLFTVNYSPVYDNNEPDDNVLQAKTYTNTFSHEGTIDNWLDEDWIKLSLNQQRVLYTRLFNSSSNIKYYVNIYDSSLNYLITFNQNTDYNNYIFPAGTYYMKIISDSYDPQNKYTLRIRNAFGPPAIADISKISSSSSVEGYIDYGYGRAWRVKGYMTIQGKLKDQNGNPVPHTDVQFVTVKVLNQEVITERTTTDSEGNFIVTLSGLDPAVGQYSYSTGMHTHYFDIIPLYAFSNGVEIYSTERFVYHFAYSHYN